jgi:hypothetical protein
MAPEIGDPRSNMTELIRLYQGSRIQGKESQGQGDSLKGERSPLCFFFTPPLSSTVLLCELEPYI